MQQKVRVDALKVIVAAIAALFIFEALYFTFFERWLDKLWIFRFHIPAMAMFFSAMLAVAVNFYEYHGFGPQEGIVRHGPGSSCVALTFDDGPNPEYTAKILDILREKEAPATFFMVGRHVLKYPDIARRVQAEGHDIGNHTFSHRDMMTASRRTLLKEVYETDEAIRRTLGVSTKLFRPPRGMISNAGRRILVEHGFTIAMWTVSAQDWRRDAPRVLVKRIIRHIRPGGIVLFHDSGALVRSEGGSRVGTVEALPFVIDELRAKGYQIVSLAGMIRELGEAAAGGASETFAPSSAGQEV